MINLCCLQVRLLTSGKALNTLKAYSLKMDCQSELKLNRGQQSKGYLDFSREKDAGWRDWGLWAGYSDSVPQLLPERRAAAWATTAAGNRHNRARKHRKMQGNGFLEGRAAAGSSQGSSAWLWRQEGQEIHPTYSSNIT